LRRATLFAVIFRLILLAGLMVRDAPPAAAQETILWFGPQAPTDLDEAALLQAVAVYTRDLRLTVRAIAETRMPRTPAGGAKAVALLRDLDARLAFWCEGTSTSGDVVLYTVDAKGAIDAHPIQGTALAGPELYRAIALKLRSVVAGTEPPPTPDADPRKGSTAPATSPGSADSHAPPPGKTEGAGKPPSPGSPSAAPAPVETVAVAGRPGAPQTHSKLSGAIGYRLSVPTGDAPWRHALALEGAFAIARRVEITLGGELAPSVEGQVAAGRVSLFDLPIRAGARWVRPGPRLWLAAGAFGALHLLSAQATDPAGNQATTFTAAAGAGLEALGRIPFGPAIAGELRLFAEAIAPRTVFWVGGTPAIELGARVGAGLGLAFRGF
jgi:hypothetical protein